MRGTMLKQPATALGDSSNGEAFRRSNPAPPVRQAVSVVKPPPESQAGVSSQELEQAGNGFKRSNPPPAQKQRVAIVEGAQVSASAQIAAEESHQLADQSLSLKAEDYAEEIGDAPDPEHEPQQSGERVALDNQEIYRIIREVALADSGADLYSAISADREYQARGQSSRHFGLGFGLVLFTQASGHLGSILRLMRRRDP